MASSVKTFLMILTLLMRVIADVRSLSMQVWTGAFNAWLGGMSPARVGKTAPGHPSPVLFVDPVDAHQNLTFGIRQ
ncbi:MAG: hypothetical protein OEU26_29415 [Candidatus Tectomicrobia bacterium]|nr:hypothetical protein [Candidatus Tectomicrobia bacterium]